MQSLCIHEMIVRAFKHVLQAVIATIANTDDMAGVIAAALNLMLGVCESDQSGQLCGVDPLIWRWLEVFLKKRYEWDLSIMNYKDVRKFAILRGLCHKVVGFFLNFWYCIYTMDFWILILVKIYRWVLN